MHLKWPPPEVFARPGWDVCVLPAGRREVEVRETVTQPLGEVVRPAVTRAVSYRVGLEPSQWGLGFHEASRTFFLFQPSER